MAETTMDFDALQEQTAADEQAAVKKQARAGQISANELKLIELEQQIERELSAADLVHKGCFGKLVRLIDSPVCKACADGDACEAELLANGADQVAEAEKEVESIVAANELDAELVDIGKAKPEADMSNPILKQIYEAAVKAVAAVEPTADPIAEAMEQKLDVSVNVAQIDISDLGDRARVPFDFNRAKDMILTEKPKDWKRVREICLSLVEDTFQHGSTAYANAKKVMARLSELKVIGWDKAAQEITYSV